MDWKSWKSLKKEPQKVYSFDYDFTTVKYKRDPNNKDRIIYDGPNADIVDKMKELDAAGNKVIIVTARRKRDKKVSFDTSPSPEELVDQLGLPVKEIHYTNNKLKSDTLKELGVEKHWDDDREELAAAEGAGINVEKVLVDYSLQKDFLDMWRNPENYLNEEIDFKDKSYKDMLTELTELENCTFIFFDTETMGFLPETDQITQIAASGIDFENGKIKERSSMNIVAALTQQSKDRLVPNTEENDRWIGQQQKMIDNSKKEISDQDKSNMLDPFWVLRLTSIANDKNEIIKKGEMSEKEMLKAFLNFIKQDTNVILVAHNLPFDMKMINGRNKLYGLEEVREGVNVKDALDTLKLSRLHFIPALQDLIVYFKGELETQQKELPDIIKSLATIDILEPNEISQKDLDLTKVSADIMSAINQLPEEQRESAKNILILRTLLQSARNTLQNSSSRLGDLSKSLKITADGWHDAFADIKMLMSVYQSMKKVLQMAILYLKEKANSLTAVQQLAMSNKRNLEEDYQANIAKYHSRGKKRLISMGPQKQGGSPYKIKISTKRSKSAPAGFGALEEMSSMGAGSIQIGPALPKKKKYRKIEKK